MSKKETSQTKIFAKQNDQSNKALTNSLEKILNKYRDTIIITNHCLSSHSGNCDSVNTSSHKDLNDSLQNKATFDQQETKAPYNNYDTFRKKQRLLEILEKASKICDTYSPEERFKEIESSKITEVYELTTKKSNNKDGCTQHDTIRYLLARGSRRIMRQRIPQWEYNALSPLFLPQGLHRRAFNDCQYHCKDI